MRSNRFAAACFDLDGALVDTGPPHREAERATLKVFGFDDLADDHPVTFGKGVILGAQLIAEHYGLSSVDDVLAEYLGLRPPGPDLSGQFQPGNGGGQTCVRMRYEGFSLYWWNESLPPSKDGDPSHVNNLVGTTTCASYPARCRPH